jgi:hypothetical protein
MGGRLTLLGGIVKWVAVPIALGCASYFLLAPRVVPALPGLIHQPGPSSDAQSSPLQQPSDPGPSIDVRVSKTSTKPRHRSHRRSVAKPPEQAKPSAPVDTPTDPPPVDPETDPASRIG